MNTIEVKNASKCFGTFKAVDSISINVHKGEIYGFLGLNGAGKTTTIRMLLGMIRPSAGACFLNSIRTGSNDISIWNKVGYLVEVPYSYPDLTVRENLEIIRRLRFISSSNAVDSIMEQLNISQYQNRRAKNLSLGNAQRLGLAKAMMHNPEILILDEPSNGLDPAGIVEIRELLLSLAGDLGVTIFISSHILGEISKFATRIGIIHKGKMLQEIETGKLINFRNRKLMIKVHDNNKAISILTEKDIYASTDSNGMLEITCPDHIDHSDKINELLVNHSCTPSIVRIDEEDLESYFLRVIDQNGGAY
jgi:ABC-2 type transport system ATP-binding protein